MTQMIIACSESVQGVYIYMSLRHLLVGINWSELIWRLHNTLKILTVRTTLVRTYTGSDDCTRA